ncbi:MAG: PilT/PilU family type 4a pilus ATPase [Planctomycetota bacterium]|nr:PilT/PilU family type 4a pilus ATPase [Planctomycetota bacterium]
MSSTQGTPAPALATLLVECARREASDLHLSVGSVPMFRLQGQLTPATEYPPLTEADLDRVASELLGARPADWTRGAIDGAISNNGARFRFNLFRRQGLLAAALRRLEESFRPLAELGMPESLYALCELRDGLVVVTGPTGCGKSTTLATLLDRVNRNRPCHIVTIEDPVEYIHKPVAGLVHQRQVGIDAPSFHDALVASLRQDPDVILVGEMRDLPTMRTALIAAQTGHLVFTTLHAGDCVGAVERLVAVFPEGEQDAVRRQLALVLRAVVAQHLLPTAAGRTAGASVSSRVPASEILIVNPAVANLIASARTAQIYSAMEAGQSAGMQTLEQDLARLWAAGRIDEPTAISCARNVPILRERVALAGRRGGPAHAPGAQRP